MHDSFFRLGEIYFMLVSSAPALILAPMEGVTDAPMRALQGATGAFTFAAIGDVPYAERQFASLETTMSNLRAQGDLLTRTFGTGSNSN